jgi:hypothetical protein
LFFNFLRCLFNSHFSIYFPNEFPTICILCHPFFYIFLNFDPLSHSLPFSHISHSPLFSISFLFSDVASAIKSFESSFTLFGTNMAPKMEQNEGESVADLTVSVLGCVGLGHNEVWRVCCMACVLYGVCVVWCVCCMACVLYGVCVVWRVCCVSLVEFCDAVLS